MEWAVPSKVIDRVDLYQALGAQPLLHDAQNRGYGVKEGYSGNLRLNVVFPVDLLGTSASLFLLTSPFLKEMSALRLSHHHLLEVDNFSLFHKFTAGGNLPQDESYLESHTCLI
jgi:hypothetical protein